MRRIYWVEGKLYEFTPTPSWMGDQGAQNARLALADSICSQGQAATQEDEALEFYRSALTHDPGHTESLLNIGTIHMEHGRLKTAEVYYRKAITASPRCALAHYNLACVLEARELPIKAIVHYRKAIAISPQDADAHFNLALAYEKTGSSPKALQHYRLFLRHAPDDAVSFRKIAEKKIIDTVCALRKKRKLIPMATPLAG